MCGGDDKGSTTGELDIGGMADEEGFGWVEDRTENMARGVEKLDVLLSLDLVPQGVGASSSLQALRTFEPADEQQKDKDTMQTGDEDLDDFEKEINESHDLMRETIESGNITSAHNPIPTTIPTTPAAKTGARSGTSKPATRDAHPKKCKADTFANLAGAEELTRQKELEVAKAKSEENKARIEMKKAELELRGKKLEHKAERRREKRRETEAKLQSSTLELGLDTTRTFDFPTLGPSNQNTFDHSQTPIPMFSEDDLEHISSNSNQSLMDDLYAADPVVPATLPSGEGDHGQ
ncbi:hypothetical protein HWV62_26915 [Athelia sp. TMB]|nr:hypothetical protein HWV62_26915 [Athelia sp. TMB]